MARKNTEPAEQVTQILPNTRLRELIAPVVADFSEKAACRFGDQYMAVLVVTKYPARLPAEWLSRIRLPGVTVHIDAVRRNAAEFNRIVSDSLSGWSFQAESKNKGAYERMQASAKRDQAAELLRLSGAENQAMFDSIVSFIVTAETAEGLTSRVKEVQGRLAANQIIAQLPWFMTKNAMLHSSPYGYRSARLHELYAMPMPASTLAAAAPFSAAGINDGYGKVYGLDTTGGVVVIDRWRFGSSGFGDRSNANMVVLGNAGGGKSTFMKLDILMEYMAGTKVIIIDPEDEYRALSARIDGQWIDAGNSGATVINPLEVWATEAVADDEEEADAGRFNPVARHLEFLKTFFALQLPDDYTAREILEIEVRELYRAHGLTLDLTNVSHITQWPTLSDLRTQIASRVHAAVEPSVGEREAYAGLDLFFKNLTEGSRGLMWDGQTNVTLGSDVLVFSTHSLQEADSSTYAAQYHLITQLMWREIQANRDTGEHLLVVMDEAHLAIDPKTPATLEAIKNFAKRIRKYGGALMVATQNVSDFLDPAIERQGRAVLDNASTKVVFGADGRELAHIVDLYDLSRAEADAVARKAVGRCLLMVGQRKCILDVKRTPKMVQLLSTSGEKSPAA
jgi:hypothetical protein